MTEEREKTYRDIERGIVKYGKVMAQLLKSGRWDIKILCAGKRWSKVGDKTEDAFSFIDGLISDLLVLQRLLLPSYRKTTDKCSFCENEGVDGGLACVASESKRMGAWLDMLVEVYMEREDDGWYIKGAVAEQKHDNGEIEAKRKILFCPFCGRKL